MKKLAFIAVTLGTAEPSSVVKEELGFKVVNVGDAGRLKIPTFLREGCQSSLEFRRFCEL